MHYLIDLSLEVLKNRQVIGIGIVTIIFILLGNYVVKYKKKVRVPKAIKAPKPVKTEEKPKEEEAEEE